MRGLFQSIWREEHLVKVLTYCMPLRRSSIKLALSGLLTPESKKFSLHSSSGPRSVADRLESLFSAAAQSRFGEKFLPARSLRSIEDFSIVESGRVTFVDIKTHFVQSRAGFSMPNLVSISKLRQLLANQTQDLVYLFADYVRSSSGEVSVVKTEVYYVWELDWSCLTIGSLGRGQLQIKNANLPIVATSIGRKRWESLLHSRALAFYAATVVRAQKELARWSLPLGQTPISPSPETPVLSTPPPRQ